MQSKVLSGVEEYIKKTPKSLEFSKSSKKVMPGGVTANIQVFRTVSDCYEKWIGCLSHRH